MLLQFAFAALAFRAEFLANTDYHRAGRNDGGRQRQLQLKHHGTSLPTPIMLPGEPAACSRSSRYAPCARQGRARAAAPPRAGIKHWRCTTSAAEGVGPGTTIKYLRRTTSAAAGNGLHTGIKYLRGAVGIGLGTTIKYLRRTTSAFAKKVWAPRSRTS
jgi:hypothetical protein